jgi:hypothetical protein
VSVLRTIPVGWDPISLTVDETRWRLFVVNVNAACMPGKTAFGWIPSLVRRWLRFLPAPAPPRCGLPGALQLPGGSVTVIDTSSI